MIFGILNRLFGRKDSNVDAVNAYVEGNASVDEQKLVEQMMRENPALENDLTTQRALLDVLRRVEKIEAPRSFAVTPEMVAAASRSDSTLSRIAELFGPQRKLAMAPAIIAGIAALSVALLTLGDITGVVDQAGSGNDSDAAAVVAESGVTISALGVAGEPGSAGAPGASTAGGASDDSGDLLFRTEKASEPEKAASSAATAAPAQAAAPIAPVTVVVTEKGDAIVVETKGDTVVVESESAPQSSLASDDDGPPSVAIEPVAPVAPSGDEPQLSTQDGDGAETDSADIESFGTGGSIDTADIAAGAGEGAFTGAADRAGDGIASGPGASALKGAAEGAGSGAGDGISLPLRQLQVVLAALALLAAGAWAGMRRVRGG